jgi:predicted metal-dependent enzyme (double-stranded beta helix superfamily)
VPDDRAPRTEGCTRVEDRRRADLPTGEPDGGRHQGDAMAGLGQRDQRLRIAGLQGDSRMHLGDAAGAVEHRPRAESLPQHQDALILEVDDVDRRPSGQSMPWPHGGKDAYREQQTPVELIVAAPEGQGEMHFAALDEPCGADGALLDEMDVDARSRRQVPREERREDALDDLGRSRDAKAPDLAAAHRVRMLGELLDVGEELSASSEEAFPLARQTNLSPRALEEPDPQLCLEVVDLAPERRLRDAQPSGGAGEGARLGDGHEVPEVTELHSGSCLPGIGYRHYYALDKRRRETYRRVRRRTDMLNLDHFITECRAALSGSSPELAIKEILQRAVSNPAEVQAALGIPRLAQLAPLYHDRDLTILNVVWTPGMAVYPHDHRMWTLIGLYGGREDNTFYRRSPEGLQVAGGKQLETGNTALLGKATIHSVVNPLRVFTGAIHIYGGDFFGTPRSDWDPETMQERPYDIERARKVVTDANERWLAECASADVS